MASRSPLVFLAMIAVTVSFSTPAWAQYGAGVVLPNAGPMSGFFLPGLPIDPGSGRPYMDYVLNVSVPDTYTIDLSSASSSAYDPYLMLIQGGMEIDRNDDGGGYPNSRISRFLAPGTYIVRVSSFRRGPLPAPAAFTIQVASAGSYMGASYSPQPVMSGQVVMPNMPVSGVFLPSLPMDPAENRPYIDYSLNVSFPATYQIDLFTANTSAYDPYLIIYQYGRELSRNDDGGGYPNARVVQYLSPGLYTVRVTSFGGAVSMPVPFTLTVVQR